MKNKNMNDENMIKVRQMLESAEKSIKAARNLLFAGKIPAENTQTESSEPNDQSPFLSSVSVNENGLTIIEGAFDGENMIGPDGKFYQVPPNYASKSKLVEGDMLKLTIDRNGRYIYKQIGPIERDNKIGVLTQDADGNFSVKTRDKNIYKILLASITYYKAEAGDELSIIIPKGKKSKWATVDALIKKASGEKVKQIDTGIKTVHFDDENDEAEKKVFDDEKLKEKLEKELEEI